MIALRCALTGVCQALQQQSLPNAWVSSNFPTIRLQLHASRPPLVSSPSVPLPALPLSVPPLAENHMLPIPGFCGSIWLCNDSGQ